MSKENNGGSAFPVYDAGDSGAVLFEGMTLRDYFAGQALTSIVSHYTKTLPAEAEIAARRCYELADAMLAEREK